MILSERMTNTFVLVEIIKIIVIFLSNEIIKASTLKNINIVQQYNLKTTIFL